MLKIDCTGLTLREGKELATYLKAMNGVGLAPVEVSLYGADGRLIEKIEKTR